MTDVEQAPSRPAEVHRVKYLSGYDGETLHDKIDSFIADHPVAMITKSYCLFSSDAEEFLVKQLGISVHVIEVDSHPNGTEIMKYVTTKYKYRTVPLIFVKGKFLGGYEDVNELYSQGTLQNNYLKNISQAERCELEVAASKAAIKPLFWFPEKVNAYVVRTGGVLTSFLAAASAALSWKFKEGQYIAYFLLVDFILRVMGGLKMSPLGVVATAIGSQIGTKPRMGRPKQFAALCGTMFSLLGSLFYFLDLGWTLYVGIAFMGGLALASGMEGFLDFCLGCYFFRIGIYLGIFSTG